jgi:NADH-quinone oxidoreductase subunit K
MPLILPLLVAVVLFCLGVYGVLARRNAITVLMALELMLNAVNINLVAFDAWRVDVLATGQTLAVFVITIAAAEIGLGLAIVLLLFRSHGHADTDRARDLVEADG